MKKEVFIIALLSLSILNLAISSAQETAPGLDDPLVTNVQKGYQQFTSENRSEYLQQEWRKLLDKNSVGKIFFTMFDFVSPFFKMILGINTISWAFLFALIIWFTIFLFLIHPSRAIFNSTPIGLVVAFILASLCGTSGLIKKVTDLLSFILQNRWIATLALIIAVLICLVIERLGMKLKKYIKKQKEESEKAKTEQAQKIIQTHGRVSKEELNSYKDK